MANIDTSLKLGNFTFEHFEVPDRIPLGGAQALVIHKLPGGDHIVQSMGRDDDPIQWTGMFLAGPDKSEAPLDRVRRLDAMRVQGRPLALTFLGLNYRVVIKSFKFVIETFFRIGYTIELEVVQDMTQPSRSSTLGSLAESMLADSKAAVALGSQINDSTLTSALSAMDSAIKSVSDFANATQATINSVLAPVSAVTQRVNSLITSVGNTLNSVTTLGGILPNNPVAQQAARFSGQVIAATQSPLLYNLQSVAGRITTNLNLINSPLTASSQTVGAGNMFQVAANTYGDATKWSGIAAANKTTDPNISAITKLTIPSNPISTDGVITT